MVVFGGGGGGHGPFLLLLLLLLLLRSKWSHKRVRLGLSPTAPAEQSSPIKKTDSKDITPRKINMEPENTPLEEENHLPNHHFQVLC